MKKTFLFAAFAAFTLLVSSCGDAEAEAKRLADSTTAATEATRLADSAIAVAAATEATRLADSAIAAAAATEATRIADSVTAAKTKKSTPKPKTAPEKQKDENKKATGGRG